MKETASSYKLLADSLRLRFLFTTKFAFDDKWVMEPRRFPFSVLWYVVDGEFLLKVNGLQYSGRPGDMFLLSKQSEVSCRAASSGITIITVRFEAEIGFAGHRIWSDMFNLPVRFPFDTGALAPLFADILETYERPAIGQSLRLQAKLQFLVAELLEGVHQARDERIPLADRPDRRIQAIVSRLLAEPDRFPTVKELCRLVRLSESHTRALFHRYTGLSPLDYLHYFKLVQAKQQLLETDDRIADIAARNGYRDANYFSRMFKKFFRHTPGEFRKQGKF